MTGKKHVVIRVSKPARFGTIIWFRLQRLKKGWLRVLLNVSGFKPGVFGPTLLQILNSGSGSDLKLNLAPAPTFRHFWLRPKRPEPAGSSSGSENLVGIDNARCYEKITVL